MLEHPDESHPLHRAAAEYLARIRGFLADLARRGRDRGPGARSRASGTS